MIKYAKENMLKRGENMTDYDKRTLRGYKVSGIQISVCLFGLTLYFASFTPVIVPLRIIPEALRQIGMGVFIFGLTSFTLTHWYSKLMTEQLETIRSEMESITIDTFDLIKSARDSGISRIYALRTGSENPEAKKAFHERLKLEFSKADQSELETKEPKTIRMMGISLRQFFNDIGELFNLGESILRNERLKLQILLINPFSAQAGLRAERESQTKDKLEYVDVEDHFNSTLFQDFQKCTKALIPYIDDSKRVEVRLYNTAPSCFLIFVNEIVFVETYHYGRSGVGGLKGGKVPVLEFHSDTNTYKELKGHFDYVWFKSRNCILDKKIADEIKNPRDSQIIEHLEDEFFWISDAQTVTDIDIKCQHGKIEQEVSQ